LSQRLTRLRWFVEYSLVDATFEDNFLVNSPNHPFFEDDPGAARIVGDDKLQVLSGDTIPGIPKHQGNVGFEFAFSDRLRFGADVALRSGIYLRGDEINGLEKTDGYAILNLRGEYQISPQVLVFARIENAFDEEYETFGLLGEPDEVFADFEDPRFFGAGPPFGAWMGVKVKL
jgi:outer membrane receptor protein involved in Fe transport